MFDGAGIAGQAVYVALQGFILALHLADLVLQGTSVFALLPVRSQAVLAKDYVVADSDRENGRGNRGKTATLTVDATGKSGFRGLFVIWPRRVHPASSGRAGSGRRQAHVPGLTTGNFHLHAHRTNRLALAILLKLKFPKGPHSSMLTANTHQNGTVTSTQLALTEISQSIPGKMLLAVSASAFVALCAHASIHLPFTPVPITLSDLAVLLVGLALGPSMAFAALMLYLAEGAAGMPVFNPGPGGLLQLLGPTGGYLMAYPLAAALAGLVSRKARVLPALTASALASAVVIAGGVVWLTVYMHHSFAAAFWLGAAPFLPGQVVKVLAAAGIYTSYKRLRRA